MSRLRLPLAVAALLGALVAASPARAADYGYFIDVETEDQLLDLLSSGEIDSGAYDALQDLLNDGIDLQTATREELYSLPNLTYEEVDKIIQYRDAAGPITDFSTLVTGGALTERKLLALTAFLLPADEPGRVDLHGRLRYRGAYVVGDTDVPPMYLQTRMATLKRALSFGVTLMLTRNELTDVRWDPNRSGLNAGDPSVHFRVPKFHLQWQSKHWHFVAGTFRIGFGQRLTLDNTNQYNPNGVRVDDQVYYNRDLTRQCRDSAGELDNAVCSDGATANQYETPDYRYPTRFRGVALGLKNLEIGDKGASMQLYGFGSFETKGINQYQIFNRGLCADPGDDANPDCAPPAVYRRLPDPLAPTSTFSQVTLPEMYNELTAGGNFTFFFNRRSHLGVTGYGSTVFWLPEGAKLDFQEWARTPWGGPFGAVGIDAAYGWKWLDVFGEVSRSFNSQTGAGGGGGGGGWAGIARATVTGRKQELEITGRYYDTAFANPYARPISAVDQYEGLRASNEAGFRVRYTGQIKDLELRAYIDTWWDLLRKVPELRFRARGEYEVATWFRPSLWIDVFDKNLEVNGTGQCYSSPFDTVDGEPIPCNGMRAQFGAQLKFLPRQGLSIAARYMHKIVDDVNYPDTYRQDVNAWFTITYAPAEWVNLRLRLRYLNEEAFESQRKDAASRTEAAGEESIWGYFEAIWHIRKQARIKTRYEVYAWIDDRSSTKMRSPNPAHWLRLEVEYRF